MTTHAPLRSQGTKAKPVCHVRGLGDGDAPTSPIKIQGYDAQGARWEPLQYLPYALLRRKWQWHLLTMLRQTLKTDAVHQLVDACFRHYPEGLVTNVHKGAVPAQTHSVARYVAKYVVSPPIAVRRIDRYDGARVTYHYRSHRTERMAYETVDVLTFIGRMVQLCG